VAVRCFLEGQIIPGSRIGIVRPLDHVVQQILCLAGDALQDAVHKCNHFGAGDVVFRTEAAVRVTLENIHVRERRDGGVVPAASLDIRETVLAREMGLARLIRQKAEEDGRDLGTGDRRVRAGIAAAADDVRNVIHAVETGRDGRVDVGRRGRRGRRDRCDGRGDKIGHHRLFKIFIALVAAGRGVIQGRTFVCGNLVRTCDAHTVDEIQRVGQLRLFCVFDRNVDAPYKLLSRRSRLRFVQHRIGIDIVDRGAKIPQVAVACVSRAGQGLAAHLQRKRAGCTIRRKIEIIADHIGDSAGIEQINNLVFDRGEINFSFFLSQFIQFCNKQAAKCLCITITRVDRIALIAFTAHCLVSFG